MRFTTYTPAMAENWTTFDNGAATSIRFANLAVRAQRLLVAKQIQNIHNLMQIHAPAVAKIPGGMEALKKAQEHAQSLLKTLKGTDDG